MPKFLKATLAVLLFVIPIIGVKDRARANQQQNEEPQTQSRIVDITADVVYPYKVGDTLDVYCLVGDFAAQHNGAIITADSAVRYSDKRIECYGDVIINKNTTYAYASQATYDGDSNQARLYSPIIKMVDGDVTLYTYDFTFNTQTNIGYYSRGGVTLNGENMVESTSGVFDSNSKILRGVGDVLMHNEEYEMSGDSVVYHTESEFAQFFRKTNIWNSNGDYLYTDRGEFDKEDDRYTFTRNGYILTEEQEIWSDSLDYYREREHVIMRHNIQLDDTTHKSISFGDYGEYWRNPGDITLTGDPVVINYNLEEQVDTLFMRADTILILTINRLEVEKLEAQRVADSIEFAREQSIRDSIEHAKALEQIALNESHDHDHDHDDHNHSHSESQEQQGGETQRGGAGTQQGGGMQGGGQGGGGMQQGGGGQGGMQGGGRPPMQGNQGGQSSQGGGRPPIQSSQSGQSGQSSQSGNSNDRGSDKTEQRAEQRAESQPKVEEHNHHDHDDHLDDIQPDTVDIAELVGEITPLTTQQQEFISMGAVAYYSAQVDSLLSAGEIDNSTAKERKVEIELTDSIEFVAFRSQMHQSDSIATIKRRLDTLDTKGQKSVIKEVMEQRKAQLKREKEAIRAAELAVIGEARLAKRIEKLDAEKARAARKEQKRSSRKGSTEQDSQEVVESADSLVVDSLAKESPMVDSLPVDLPPIDSLATDSLEQDTLYRLVIGVRNSRTYRQDFQSVSDSLVTNSADSTIRLYYAPILWHSNNQIVSEQTDIYTKMQEITHAEFQGNPLMSNQVIESDTTYFNQITGKLLTTHFRDQEVYRNDVDGNAQTIYFMQDEPTGEITGLMVMESGSATFYIEERNVEGITYRTSPVYTIYPIENIPPDQSLFFKDFKWHSDIKPTRDAILTRDIRESQRDEKRELTMPEFPINHELEQHKRNLIEDNLWRDRSELIDAKREAWLNSLGFKSGQPREEGDDPFEL
ncbi:MAG: OstA-like protein [Rikenellaceae bacterium]